LDIIKGGESKKFGGRVKSPLSGDVANLPNQDLGADKQKAPFRRLLNAYSGI
jgi:hypothetical protein